MPDGGLLPALPGDLNVEGARLPAVYEAAKTALALCSRLDECQDWADKAEALASYARQMNDPELRRYCDRIQARAVHRAGEVLKEIPPAANQHEAAARAQEGAHPTRSQAATEAGLSEHQRKTALRVANVPAEEFEAAVEAAEPATVTRLAEMGKQPRPVSTDHLGGRDPDDFRQGTKLAGLLSRFLRETKEVGVTAAVRGLTPDEIGDVRLQAKALSIWLGYVDLQTTRLGESDGV